jgi:hypothetical protein
VGQRSLWRLAAARLAGLCAAVGVGRLGGFEDAPLGLVLLT